MELKSILEILDIAFANPYIAATEANNVIAPLVPPRAFAFPTAIISTDNDPTANTNAPIVLPASSISYPDNCLRALTISSNEAANATI